MTRKSGYVQRYRRRKWLRANAPKLWVGGAVVAVILLMIGYNLSQTQKTQAVVEAASRSNPPTSLLTLAEPVQPLRGGYDMTSIPQQPPQPQQPVADAPAPHLDLPSDQHDFGYIPEQPDVAHVFAVQNTGEADLEISNLVTSCGCTTAKLSSSVIPPGQRADLTVVFDPDYHETSGSVTRLVWFKTNDVTQPWAELRITANVQ
jgi:hypothetical protein